MAATEQEVPADTAPVTVSTVPADQDIDEDIDENEPPPQSIPYAAAEDDPTGKNNIHYGGDESQSEEATSPLIQGGSNQQSSATESEQGSIQIDLDIRETRLTLWSIAYIIFCIGEFTANRIIAAQSQYNSTLQSAYQTWAASDFILLIGAVLLFIECNPIYILNDINSNQTNLQKILRYIICALFILGGFLRWIGLGKHNHVECNNSQCNSKHFAQDFMATWFSFVIAIDALDLFKMINIDQRCLRMVIYASLIILMTILVLNFLGNERPDNNVFNQNCWKCYWNSSETGWFFILFMLIVILIIGILIMMKKYDGLLSNDKIRKYFHFGIAIIMYIGIGLAYFSDAILYHIILCVTALIMVTFDLMCLT